MVSNTFSITFIFKFINTLLIIVLFLEINLKNILFITYIIFILGLLPIRKVLELEFLHKKFYNKNIDNLDDYLMLGGDEENYACGEHIKKVKMLL